MIKVKEANQSDFARFYGGLTPTSEMVGFAVWRDRIIVGFGGLIKEGDVWRGFMDVPRRYMSPIALRYAKKLLRGRVLVACDNNIENADVFLSRAGFRATGILEDNLEVWEWQDSQH